MLAPKARHPFLKQVYKDVHNGYNRNILIVGKTRSGKSYSAMRLGELWDYGKFGIRNVCWSVQQFAELLQNGKLKDGDVILIDEAGIGIASRAWYEQENKLFTEVMQLYGYLHLVVIFTTPAKKYIDNHARSLFDYQLEPVMKDTKKKVVKLKLLKLQYNQDEDKIYRKGMVVNNIRYPFIYLKKPSAKLCAEYEKASQEWKNEFIKKMNQTFKANEAKGISAEDVVKEILKNPEEYMKEYNQRKTINRTKIETKFGIGETMAKRVKLMVEDAIVSNHT